MSNNILKPKTLYLVFGDARNQDDDDLDDICDNINYFDKNCEIVINHPTSTHKNVKLRHIVQPIGTHFIFGIFIEFLNLLNKEEYEFDHVCLFSANQYLINSFIPIKNINYLQFYNCPEWDYNYTGKDFSNLTIGNPLIQCGFNWDENNMGFRLGIDNAMISNWEYAFLTKETINLCQKHINDCLQIYPYRDCIQLFPGYMALKSEQPWLFPPFFGTFDPSNKINNCNWIITHDQIDQKHNEGYCSIKRVNYKKDCSLKEHIRKKY